MRESLIEYSINHALQTKLISKTYVSTDDNKISKVSKPGRKVYTKIKKLPSYYNGYGVTIVSTSKGIMTDKKARRSNLGGEILCQVF